MLRMSMRIRFLAYAAAAAIALATAGQAPVHAQAPVRGIFNWIHGTRDAERAFAFYHDVFGVELARSPFAGGRATAPEPIRPAAQAGSDPLVWDLTNTHGSRFRTVFMRAPDTPFGLELSEFFDIERGDRAPNPWDPGASTLSFSFRNLDVVIARLKARGTPVVTLGGEAVSTRNGRAPQPPTRFDWKLQDVGSPQMQLEVSGLDDLIARTKTAGYRFLSIGAKPIQRAFGKFVFAIAPDAILVEFVEPATR
jgi:catechol 2,3-dioxygenase-like lactoylglutathione lyase family enzyme